MACDRCGDHVKGDPYEMPVPHYSIARLCENCVRLLLGDAHPALGHFSPENTNGK